MFSSNSRGMCRSLIGPGRMALLLAAGVTLLAVAGAQAASPQFVVTQCGVVLDVPGATYELQGDLTCQNTVFQEAALTIVGDGIHLKLNGHTLRRGQSSTVAGVWVQSHNVTITQGAILEFFPSLRTAPVAQFTMNNMTLDSDVLLLGQSHTLKDSVARELGIIGTDHVVKGNTLSFVAVANCTLSSCGYVLDTSNIDIVGNTMPRLRLQEGVDSVVVRDNIVADNVGITVCGNNHLISTNTITLALGSRRFIGIRVGNGCAASAVVIKNNTIEASPGGVGILLESGVTDAFVKSNTAGGFVLFDLLDDNPNCGSNTWKSNTFGTASQSCIQ